MADRFTLTRDLDLLGRGDNGSDAIADVFRDICAQSAWPGHGWFQTVFNGVNPVQGPVAAEVVTSISNGAEHCTR